jgi:hypothetical protein
MRSNIIETIPQRFVESLPYSVPLVLLPFPLNFVTVGSVAAIITGIQIANSDSSLNLAARVSTASHGAGFYFTMKGVEQIARSIFSASFIGSCARCGIGLSSFGIGVATLIAADLFSEAINR